MFGKSNSDTGLRAFFAENAATVENEKYVTSERFKDPGGQPMEWEIRCLANTEDEALRQECTKQVLVPGKKGMRMPQTDMNLYLGKLAASCTVFPNLHDSELQNSYGVMNADQLLKKMLTPGEYADYLSKVQGINGFDVSFEDLVVEAKN